MVVHDTLNNRKVGPLWMFREDRLMFDWGYLRIGVSWRCETPMLRLVNATPEVVPPPSNVTASRAVLALRDAEEGVDGHMLTRNLHRILNAIPARLEASIRWRVLLSRPHRLRSLRAAVQFFAHMGSNPCGDGCSCWRP